MVQFLPPSVHNRDLFLKGIYDVGVIEGHFGSQWLGTCSAVGLRLEVEHLKLS